MAKKSNRLPKGAWVAHSKALLESPAWRAKPHSLTRILDRLEIEHMSHAGTENGNLYVSYGQFVSCGISRRAIKPALELGEGLGLLKVIRPMVKLRGDLRDANAYEITYLPVGSKSARDGWATVTDASAEALLAKYRGKQAVRSGRK